MFDVAVTCLALTALLSYINHRFIGLPTTIGVMIIALALSGSLLVLDVAGFGALRDAEAQLLSKIDFSRILMHGMLSVLLFAGALHVDLHELTAHRWQVATLAFLGTLLSALAVAATMWFALPFVGIALPFAYCVIFGALISPTDPIAVIGLLRSSGAPKNLELVIAGESLFNDGVAVVIFTLGLGMLASGDAPSIQHALTAVVFEVGGGIVFGLLLGGALYYLLKGMDGHQDEVLLTLAVVMAGYSLATHLHVSGPLAMVVAGLIIGNHGRALAMSEATRRHLDSFWDMLDSILNAVLFVLIGLSVILIDFSVHIALAAAIAVVVTLGARAISAGAPIAIFGRHFKLPDGSWKVVTWGGLRGGISVALALSLPTGGPRDTVLALTYAVVIFSILCQGLTLPRVIRSAVPKEVDAA
jgi:CPA1 family monovalent cation:H+ antiporter